MPTYEEIEHAILHEIEENQKEQDTIIRAYFSWKADPTSIDDEMLLKVIRWRRNGLLVSCDWTQIPDSVVDKQAWIDYRQQLRDLPSQNENPRLIVFPEQPA
jgi:hypothetical protein